MQGFKGVFTGKTRPGRHGLQPGLFNCRAATVECVELAPAFLAGGSLRPHRARRTRPAPPAEAAASPGRGWPLSPPLVSARESEESGSKLHALQIGPGEN